MGRSGVYLIYLAGLLSAFSIHASEDKTHFCGTRLLGVQPWYTTSERRFLTRKKLLANLPSRVRTAFVLNHRYSYTTDKGSFRKNLFSSSPIPAGSKGSNVDWARAGFRDPIPTRFIIGDGSSSRVLIGVDLTPGSPLDKWVRKIHHSIELGLGNKLTTETVIQRVSQNIADFLGPSVSGGFDWDRLIRREPQPDKDAFFNLAADHPPLDLGGSLPVVALEHYIEAGEAYCMGQALLAWLVLRSFGIPSRLHLGANAAFINEDIGHTSVELEDGRIVDPAGFMVIAPQHYHKGPRMFGLHDTDWVFTPGYLTYRTGETRGWLTWRVRYTRYLVMVLP